MLDHFDICGKRFLISGASSGLGLGMVDSFIEQGAQVVGLGRNASLFMELESKYGSSFEGIRIDLSEINEIESVLMGLITGKFDGFVHAAGVIYRRPIKLMTSDTFTEIMKRPRRVAASGRRHAAAKTGRRPRHRERRNAPRRPHP